METEARYLGVANYGSEETNKDNRDHFAYRFEIDGKEQMLKIENGEGETAYVIQNVLKEGCDYDVTIEDGVVTRRTRCGCSRSWRGTATRSARA